MRHFEDIAIGDTVELGSHLFTAQEIKRFAAAYDPQPFHTDEAAATESHFGRLCASGWHTLAVWMKLNVRQMQRLAGERAGPRLGPSPGFDELKWLKPVYAGDTISFRTEVVSARPSRSRPGWGLVSIRNSGRNQNGEEVISFVGHVFVLRREGGAPSGASSVAREGDQ